MAKRKTAAQKRREQIEQTCLAYAAAGAGVAWLGWRHPLLLGLTLGVLGLVTVITALLVILAHRLSNPWRHYITQTPEPAPTSRRGQARARGPRTAAASSRRSAAPTTATPKRRDRTGQQAITDPPRNADGTVDRDALIAELRSIGGGAAGGKRLRPGDES
jgi:hypothetical protein